jgi:dienelactone hydrolase
MIKPNIFRPHDEVPARASFRSTGPFSTDQAEGRTFQFVSRGDFVSGQLLLPETVEPRPAPLVLVTFASGRAASLAEAEFAEEWVRLGFALAAIDLPLHGDRSSPKLSERLTKGAEALMSGVTLDLDTRALVEEFARQSTSDLVRAVEAIGALPEIDSHRIGLMGIGLGALTSAFALPHTENLAVGVLALGDACIRDRDLDPVTQLATGRIDPECAVLIQSLANSKADQSLAAMLHRAASNTKEWAAYPDAADASRLPFQATSTARDFLSRHLGL